MLEFAKTSERARARVPTISSLSSTVEAALTVAPHSPRIVTALITQSAGAAPYKACMRLVWLVVWMGGWGEGGGEERGRRRQMEGEGEGRWGG